MKIICKDKAEYISLMKTSKYLHDHGMVLEGIDCPGLNQDFELVNFFIGIYLSNKEFGNKSDFIEIETGENIHFVDNEIRKNNLI